MVRCRCSRGQWVVAEREMQTAISLLPNDPEVWFVHALFVAESTGHLRRCLEGFEAAFRLAPLTPLMPLAIGSAKLMIGGYDDAASWVERALAQGYPKFVPPAPDAMHTILIREGRFAEAADCIAATLSPEWRAAGALDVLKTVHEALADASLRARANAALRALEQHLAPEQVNLQMSKRLMLWHALMGDLDSAYRSVNQILDHLARSRMIGTAWGMLWMPEMQAFRCDRRFQSLVDRFGFPEYWRQHGGPDERGFLRA